MSAGSSIDYDALTQDALRGVVRAVLLQIANAKSGLPGDHHFYIAFNTQAPGVVLSRRLKEKYPEEMMIVLQHRFWDLAVQDEGFEVKLTFDGIPERLYIPFQSLKVFFDPSVRFSLQFGEHTASDDGQDGSGRRRRASDDKGGDRRAKPKQRSRSDNSDTAPDGQTPQPAVTSGGQPTVLAPRPSETPRPAQPQPAATSESENAPDHKPATAKVFSLDSFRKKK